MRLFFYLHSPFSLRFGYVFCDFIALVALALDTEIVKISKININIAYSSKNKEYKESLVKRSVMQSIRSYYETLFCLSRSQKKLNKSIFKVENRFLYSQSSRDFGLILLSAHNRSVDLLLNQLTIQEDVTAIFKPIKIKALNEFVKKNRQKSGSSVFETNFTGVKELFSALKRGEAVAMAADQVPAKNMGVYENFFGRKVYTTNLIPSLHSKTKAPIVSVAIHSDNLTNRMNTTNLIPSLHSKTKAPIVSVAIHSDNLTNQLYIRYGSKSTYKEKSQYNAKKMNKEIENIININPEDYNWEYKRFKKQEVEDKSTYK